MATIKDVAKAAQTSPSTVSRVLNGTIAVSPELKERVNQAVKQLNYQSNIAGRNLRMGIDQEFGPDFELRSRQNEDIKKLIAKYAAEQVRVSDVIILDTGSTVSYMVLYLPEGTVIYTNSLAILQPAAKRQLTVQIAPGLYVPGLAAVFGVETEAYLREKHGAKYFFSTARVDVRTGLFNTHPSTRAIKRTILNAADMAILVVDHTKFCDAGLPAYADLREIDLLITDYVPEAFFPALRDLGVQIVEVGELERHD